MKTMAHGPYTGLEVEEYDGDNPNKVGTVFCPSLGVRLNAKTGEIMPNASLQGPMVAAVVGPKIIGETETVVADLKAQHEEEIAELKKEYEAELAKASKAAEAAAASSSGNSGTVLNVTKPAEGKS